MAAVCNLSAVDQHLFVKTAKKKTKDELDCLRKNEASEASDLKEPPFVGGFKNVHKHLYSEGSRKGEFCVWKVFKIGSVFADSYFGAELKVVKETAEIVDKFNRANVSRLKILVNQPAVWVTMDGRKELGLVEPFISNFQKFNSNSGWSTTNNGEEAHLLLQALSHFSYHNTSGQRVICDLQGGIYPGAIILTDPVVTSRMRGQFGPTDFGVEGMETFFARHICNRFCDRYISVIVYLFFTIIFFILVVGLCPERK